MQPNLYKLSNCLIFLSVITIYRIFWLNQGVYELYGDEAQYWVWAQNFSFGYYSKPPMVSWLIGLTTSVCGGTEFCIRLSSPIIHFITSIFIYLSAKTLFDKKTAFYSALTYATLPAAFVSSFLISSDAALIMFWSAAFYFFIRAFWNVDATQASQIKYWILAGIAAGFGMLSKYNMLVFLFSAVIFLGASKDKRYVLKSVGFWLSIIMALLIYMPNAIWNLNNGLVSYLHTGQNAYKPSSGLQFSEMVEFLSAQVAVFGLIPTVAMILMLVTIKKRQVTEQEKLLWALTLPFIILISGVALFSRAHANWAAPAYVGGSILVVHGMLYFNKAFWAKLSIVLHILVCMTLLNYKLVTQVLDYKILHEFDPFYRLLGAKEMALEFDKALKQYPDAIPSADQRRIMAALIYYTKPQRFDMVKWNPDQDYDDFFEMNTDLSKYNGEDVVLISEFLTEENLKTYFSQVSLVDTIKIRKGSKHEEEYRIYYLKGFKGY